MSIWVYRKEKDGKKSIYSISIPFEAILFILGMIAALLVPGIIRNPPKSVPDSIGITILGFVLFLISKISLFVRGIWNRWGTKNMSNNLPVGARALQRAPQQHFSV